MGNFVGSVLASTKYKVECFRVRSITIDPNANKIIRNLEKIWEEQFNNIVVTTGLNKLLDATFKTGLTTPAWYVGFKGSGSMIAADTMSSHGGWAELTPYSDSTRQAFTPGSISSGSVDNSASKAVFNINGSSTIYGCFLTDNSTKGGTTGILYGGGDFGSSRPVVNGDILNITVTLTQTSA